MKKKKRFGASDWVDLGLAELSKNGAEAVKLEAICEMAQRTRGSFYYHFEDHSAFLLALAQSWTKRQTADVAQNLNADGTAHDKASALTEASLEIDFRLELGIRELARRYPSIASVVKAADKKRLKILSEIYAQRFQLDPSEAEDFAFLEYAAFSGMILLTPDMPLRKQRELATLYDGLIQNTLSTKS